MSGYDQMQNVAAHAGGQQARRQNYGMRKAAQNQDVGCHFPAPAPFRVYCQPAAFHRVNGNPYQNMTVAYGSSRPLDRYY
ncbi:MAG TPA: hypothetical protein PKD85_00915 [Saprospiraceae bacterium]|nr:hypothetical protein [Saprospiraceae bacterium]